jgi:hypothetical protein
MAEVTTRIDIESYALEAGSLRDGTLQIADIRLTGVPLAHGIRWKVFISFLEHSLTPAASLGVVSLNNFDWTVWVFLNGRRQEFSTWYEILRNNKSVALRIVHEEIGSPVGEANLADRPMAAGRRHGGRRVEGGW